MKNKVLKQMLAFSLAVALVGGNSVATFAAEPTNGTRVKVQIRKQQQMQPLRQPQLLCQHAEWIIDYGTNYAQYHLQQEISRMNRKLL